MVKLNFTGSPLGATAMSRPASVVALTGGIGGAKLALGLQRVLEAGQLTTICNTGDDFRHLGLDISPDIDTILYTLSGLSDPERGWGRREETWSFMAALEEFGGATWFRLGDKDLATHVERTRRLGDGETLSSVTDSFRRRLGLATRILPMSDDVVRTRLLTADGWLDFQDYFVRQRCRPAVTEIAFAGAETAKPPPKALAVLSDPELRAVVICPSNPLISIEPILAVPGIREALASCAAPVVGVSPIIGGQAVRGPTAKLMRELGLDSSATAVAQRYADIIDAWVVDRVDMETTVPAGVDKVVAETMMVSLEDRERLASAVLDFAQRKAPNGEFRRWQPADAIDDGVQLESANVKVYPDADALARAAAGWLSDRLSSTEGILAVALSGGSTPKRLYELLAGKDYRDRIPWERVHWFWGDERFVPPDDPRSNFSMFEAAVLSNVPVPKENVHAVPTVGLTPEEAADAYAQELQRFHGDSTPTAEDPLFDVVLLGLGDDGHTASLFPGSSALEEQSSWASAVNSDEAVPRITLTYPALESCRDCVFLVTGSAKKAILSAVFRNEEYPVTRLKPLGRCAWLVDRHAAPDCAESVPASAVAGFPRSIQT